MEESYDEPPDESQTESDEESDSEVPWKAMEEEAEENDYGNDEELNRATQNTIRYDRHYIFIMPFKKFSGQKIQHGFYIKHF